jgi:L-ascorbate metabolism protein UlaG (beta-lactamase superfamily)
MKTSSELINEINECTLEKEKLAFWWLGQLGYVVKAGDTIMYFDAFLSDVPGRNVPPLLRAEDITNADFIFGSHDHIDHIDRDVWYQISLSSPKAKFVVPKLLIKILSKDLNIPENRFLGLDDGISITEKGINITGIAAAHELLNQDAESGCYPYLGYIVEANGFTLYHSGDTCIYEGMYTKLRKWDRLDVMFVPINGRDARRYRANWIGNMTYQEAVDLAGSLKPGLVVPGHYEMFDFNSEDPLLFTDYISAKYPEVKYLICKHGEMYSL